MVRAVVSYDAVTSYLLLYPLTLTTGQRAWTGNNESFVRVPEFHPKIHSTAAVGARHERLLSPRKSTLLPAPGGERRHGRARERGKPSTGSPWPGGDERPQLRGAVERSPPGFGAQREEDRRLPRASPPKRRHCLLPNGAAPGHPPPVGVLDVARGFRQALRRAAMAPCDRRRASPPAPARPRWAGARRRRGRSCRPDARRARRSAAGAIVPGSGDYILGNLGGTAAGESSLVGLVTNFSHAARLVFLLLLGADCDRWTGMTNGHEANVRFREGILQILRLTRRPPTSGLSETG
jgi:hypothetical protein